MEELEVRGYGPYAAMTINERLHAAGLMGAFDAAVLKRDKEKVLAILFSVDVTRVAAESVAAQAISRSAARVVNQKISELVDCWCERKELAPLAVLLPAWLANNELMDGWGDLGAALRTAAKIRQLPESERAVLESLWVEVDSAIRNR